MKRVARVAGRVVVLLVLVCLPAVVVARAGVLGQHVPLLPPVVGSGTDQPIDAEGVTGAVSVPVAQAMFIRPPRPTWAWEIPHTLLAANQAHRRSRVARISLPPPRGV